jgi:integrase
VLPVVAPQPVFNVGNKLGSWLTPAGIHSPRLAVSAAANVKAPQRMLGHAKASMTLDIYADLFDEDLDGVADRLDAAIQATADALRTASKA